MPTSSTWVAPLTTSAELAAIAGQWNRLAAGVPFRGYDWLESWWQAYGGPLGTRMRELNVLAVFDNGGALLGLAPWYLQRTASHRILRFLGSGEACSEYATVLSERGHEREVALALADWLTDATPADPLVKRQRAWDRIDLGGVYVDDKTLTILVELLAERDHLVHRRDGLSCWRIPLPTTWEEYLGQISKSHRKQVRKLQRRWLDTRRAQLHVVQREEQLPGGLELLERLHKQRRASLGDRGCFASTAFSAFHQTVSRRLLRAGALRLYWLSLDGVPIAVEYQIDGEGVVYAYQSGIDPAALEFEPGRLIMLATLQQAIASGRQACDLLRGDEAYKAHWRAAPRPTQNIRIIRDTPAGRMRRTLWIAGDNVKSWIKSGLEVLGTRPPGQKRPAPIPNHPAPIVHTDVPPPAGSALTADR